MSEDMDYTHYGQSEVTGNPEKTSTHAQGEFAGCEAFPSVENPQYLLTLPPGQHTINIKVTRQDMNKTDALVLVLYKAQEDGSGRLFHKPEEDRVISKSSYRKQFSAIVVAGVEGGDQKYVVMVGTNNSSPKGPYHISVLTDGASPQLDPLSAQMTTVAGEWSEGKCGGYCKPDNPQFLFEVPAGEHLMYVELARADEVKDQGLIFFVFNYVGDGNSRIGVARKADAAVISPFKTSTSVAIKENLPPGKYVVLACLQNAGSTGPLNVTVKAEGFLPEVTELTGGEVAATAAPQVAAPSVAPRAGSAKPAANAAAKSAPAVSDTTAVIDGTWHGERAGGYKKVENPQFLLSLPSGEHQVMVEVNRKEDHGGQGLVAFIYDYRGKGARMTRVRSSELVGQTNYKITETVETSITLAGGPNKYMILPCLKTAGVDGNFSVSVSGSVKPHLRQLGSKDHAAGVLKSQWTAELSGGYMSSANPQFLLELPKGEHKIRLQAKRLDMKADQGMIIMVYQHAADGDKLVSDDAALKKCTLKAKSEFKPQDSVILDGKLDGFPATYMVLLCLQNAGATGPVSLTMDSDCIQNFVNLREPSALPNDLSGDLERVAGEIAEKPQPVRRKLKAVEPPPE